jgi:hypothetical protein
MDEFVEIPTAFRWASGDSRPAMATSVPIRDLSARHHLDLFRDKDDLDWLVGALYLKAWFGPLLIMQYDNNPAATAEFYVDSRQDLRIAQAVIAQLFGLSAAEITWVPDER